MLVCRKCGSKAIIKRMQGMYYVTCSKCDYYNPWQFMGLKPSIAIDMWNLYNSKNFNIKDLENEI